MRIKEDGMCNCAWKYTKDANCNSPDGFPLTLMPLSFTLTKAIPAKSISVPLGPWKCVFAGASPLTSSKGWQRHTRSYHPKDHWFPSFFLQNSTARRSDVLQSKLQGTCINGHPLLAFPAPSGLSSYHPEMGVDSNRGNAEHVPMAICRWPLRAPKEPSLSHRPPSSRLAAGRIRPFCLPGETFLHHRSFD